MSGVTVVPFEQIKTPYTREQVCKRMEALIGQPFKRLPGNPSEHSVLAVLSDGTKLRVADAEMLYNDWELIRDVYGPDAWDSIPHSAVEIEAFPIVRAIYEGGAN